MRPDRRSRPRPVTRRRPTEIFASPSRTSSVCPHTVPLRGGADPTGNPGSRAGRLPAMAEWQLRGTYLEACNCDAICPCRRIGGRQGGRSTHGICLGALSWRITSGQADDVELADLAIVLASRYSDDERGSPWSYRLYLDERAAGPQRDALAAIF